MLFRSRIHGGAQLQQYFTARQGRSGDGLAAVSPWRRRFHGGMHLRHCFAGRHSGAAANVWQPYPHGDEELRQAQDEEKKQDTVEIVLVSLDSAVQIEAR